MSLFGVCFLLFVFLLLRTTRSTMPSTAAAPNTTAPAAMATSTPTDNDEVFDEEDDDAWSPTLVEAVVELVTPVVVALKSKAEVLRERERRGAMSKHNALLVHTIS